MLSVLVLLRSAAMTIRAGGNVLVPCYSSGVIYDLLECLYQFIESANLGTTPFYFISPIANSSLEFSQIFAEWWAAVYRKLLDSVVKVCDFRFYCFSSACARLACPHFSTSSTTSHDAVTLIIRNTVSMFCYLIEVQQTAETITCVTVEYSTWFFFFSNISGFVTTSKQRFISQSRLSHTQRWVKNTGS